MIFSSFSFASLTYSLSYNEDIRVLKSLDIDEHFLHDSQFLKMKEDVVAGYRKDRLIQKYDEAFVFVPILKDMINEAEIPASILYLAMAESEFSVRAYSPKRAAGIWQFMPATARLYGLQIDHYVDERRDPIKSTEAAIRFLKDLHAKFGKWYLAALAYNCGPGRLDRAIKKAKTDNLGVLLNPKKRYIPRESRNYIRKIVTLAMAFNDVEHLTSEDSLYFLNRGASYPITTLLIEGGSHLESVAESMGMTTEELRKYNRHLRYNFLPPRKTKYPIYAPYERLALYKENYDPSKQKKSDYYIHIVSRGETLSQIGKQYGIPWGMIKDANQLKNNRLSIKQKLVIPTLRAKKSSKPKPSRNPAVLSITHGGIHVIRRGDTIYGIARRYNVSEKALLKANSLNSNRIKAGDTLIIPN